MKTFTINDNKYTAKEIDFNAYCEFEDMGLSFFGSDMGKRGMSFVRGYLAYCGNMSLEDAGKQMECHIINGGDFTQLSEIFAEEVEKSSFFQALRNKKEMETKEEQTAEETTVVKATPKKTITRKTTKKK